MEGFSRVPGLQTYLISDKLSTKNQPGTNYRLMPCFLGTAAFSISSEFPQLA